MVRTVPVAASVVTFVLGQSGARMAGVNVPDVGAATQVIVCLLGAVVVVVVVVVALIELAGKLAECDSDRSVWFYFRRSRRRTPPGV
ncbi:hypothetical protein [Nocardioides piscis]|uniref:Uncharacterized protein n=1 Tax=Nocardioides piscis TaxID=2714938 RepID=A0A6G7YD78_9ACTN|nr:hypothetical protein [Nocardioides piscis]QIK74755.1 hypothetical protein G7071_04255 [Nocardioides piscis]